MVGDECKDIYECKLENDNDVNALCTNIPGSYTGACVPSNGVKVHVLVTKCSMVTESRQPLEVPVVPILTNAPLVPITITVMVQLNVKTMKIQ